MKCPRLSLQSKGARDRSDELVSQPEPKVIVGKEVLQQGPKTERQIAVWVVGASHRRVGVLLRAQRMTGLDGWTRRVSRQI